MKTSEEIRKYMGWDSNWAEARESVIFAERTYAKHLFDIRDDITRRQASEEFWKRVAEFYDFNISFKRESPQPSDTRQGEE